MQREYTIHVDKDYLLLAHEALSVAMDNMVLLDDEERVMRDWLRTVNRALGYERSIARMIADKDAEND